MKKSEPCWYSWNWFQKLFYPQRHWYVTVVVNTREGILNFLRVPVSARTICVRALEERIRSLHPEFQFYCVLGVLQVPKIEFDCLQAHVAELNRLIKVAALKPAAS